MGIGWRKGVFPEPWSSVLHPLEPCFEEGHIPWDLNGGRQYSLDPGWGEGVFPAPSKEGGGISWTQNGGRRYSLVHAMNEGAFPGPWMDGGGMPGTLDGVKVYSQSPGWS